MTVGSPPHPALVPDAVAVVTGGASGIGLAAAHRFLELGLKVCIADRDLAALDAAEEELNVPDRVLARPVDVSSFEAMTALSEEIVETWGKAPSVLMNNAATGQGGDVFEDLSKWTSLIDVNLMGVLHGIQAFVPAMLESDAPGLVINTGSKQGITQPPGNTAYNVSKSAVKALSEGLAHTLRAKTGDRVTAHLLIPGFTYTGMVKAHFGPEKPEGAWLPEQVAGYMLDKLQAGDFYILCPDDETTTDMDYRRIVWTAGDIIENRPALSRWHPDYAEAFERFMDV